MTRSPQRISHHLRSLAVLALILIAALLPPTRAAAAVDSGSFGAISSREFQRLYAPVISAKNRVRAVDFLKGGTASDAIDLALASRKNPQAHLVLVLDSRDWLIDRAILLPANTELVIDGCKLKLADGVFDNLIRTAGLEPDPQNPHGLCLSVEPVKNIKITGLNGAILEGADNPFTAPNPKTGVNEKWIGDYFGWRTVSILFSAVERYEISGLTIQKTHCWAISQDAGCKYGYLHDLIFHTNVKNGDGIDFRNGSAYCLVENISGTTSDDTIACTALDSSVLSVNSRYIWPMQPMGYPEKGAANADIHDIAIRNITTTGQHHGVICLSTSPRVYNLTIEHVIEATPSTREACVKIYTGYGNGYQKGNLRNINVRHVVSRGAKYAVMVKADVRDVSFNDIKQLKKEGAVNSFTGNSDNLSLTNSEP